MFENFVSLLDFFRGFVAGGLMVGFAVWGWYDARDRRRDRNLVPEPERISRRVGYAWEVEMYKLEQERDKLYSVMEATLLKLRLGANTDIVAAINALREALKRRGT